MGNPSGMERALDAMKKLKDCDAAKCTYTTVTVTVPLDIKARFMALSPRIDALNEEREVLMAQAKDLNARHEVIDAEAKSLWAELKTRFPELQDCDRTSMTHDYNSATGAFCRKNCLSGGNLMQMLMGGLLGQDEAVDNNGNDIDVIPQ